MKILVTGGAGMIGSHCAEYFAQKKNRVVVIDNLMRSQIFGSTHPSVEYNWNYLKTVPRITRYKHDIRDAAAMRRIFTKEKPDVVIHTAGQPGVRFSIENPIEDSWINATGTINVLESFRRCNNKGVFIYTSTNKVYGDNVNLIPIVEQKKRYAFRSLKGISEKFSIDLTGHTPYGVSKLAGDLYTQDYTYAYGLKTAIFRMSCIYGTRQFGFEDQGWLAWFAIRFFQNKPVTIYGDGKQVRDVLWVGDLIRAFDAFIRHPKPGQVFNMGGGASNTLSLLELIDICENIFKRKIRVQFDEWRKFDQKIYISDIAKAKKVLKWSPRVSPDEGVARLADWIQANPKLF